MDQKSLRLEMFVVRDYLQCNGKIRLTDQKSDLDTVFQELR